MAKKHYLLKVLGLNGIPKIVTFGITLISFPLLMRSIGPSEYGIVIFIGSTLALFEVLIDLGVSSASGKAIAAMRTHQPQQVRSEFLVWVRLQVLVATIGFVPMLFLVHFAIEFSPSFRNERVIWIMAVAMMFSMWLNFIRINLNSLLAFKSLAVLDTFQSVLISGGYFIIAFWYPSAVGLAIAGLTTSVSALLLAIVLLKLQFSSIVPAQGSLATAHNSQWNGRHKSIKSRLKESGNFFWLRLSTRVYQEGPIILIGRLLGPEIIGVIGAFRKISEIVSTPYLVIGNALMVRVHEVSNKGFLAMQSYWDAAIRIGSTSLIFCALTFLLSHEISQVLLPDSDRASEYFGILSPLIAVFSLFGMLAPMSDYKGGLTMRNSLLTATALVQLCLFWIAYMIAGELFLISMFVVVNLCLVVGYACITHKVLFDSFTPIIRLEVYKFVVIVVISCGFIFWLRGVFNLENTILSASPQLIGIICILFLAISALGILLSGIWRFYFNRNFFEF